MGNIDLKKINGLMDTDSPNENIGQNFVKYARNVRYRGEQSNYRIENVPGLRLIPNSLPVGNNECIGRFYDENKHRIFYFNYNSNSNHGIYILDINDETITPLLVCGTNTNGDILNFTLNEPVFAVKMLYGDAEQGDTLYFNDCQKKPCQINIEKTIAGTYGVMEKDYLEVVKYPANRPPLVAYGDDGTVTVNNLRKKLFKFKTRPVYFSREKAVTSEQSEIPLPLDAQIITVDQNPQKNCKISIVYETLEADVEAIEILGAVSEGKLFSDFFLIQTINKAENGLNDNDIAIFDFYNNQAYQDIDPEDSIQLFDLVPIEANSLEFLNGNVPIYGGITEGFDLIEIDGSTSSGSISRRDLLLPFVFTASQSGKSAFGTGDIHIIFVGDPVTNVSSGQQYTFTIYTTNDTISYTLNVPFNNVITGLNAAALLLGYTVVSVDSQNLVINKTGESLQRVTVNTVLNDTVYTPSYNWNDRENYGIVYFDKADRTNGVITNSLLPYQTVNYTETGGIPNLPQLTMQINSRPPDWAYSFSPVRTKSLAKQRFLYWLSDATYKDKDYAYIGIQNLTTFIDNNPSSSFLQYDVVAGDRIRFIKVLSGSVNTVYTNNDFEVLSQNINPIINGIQRTGRFIKIALPTTSGTFDFGTNDFANYEIEIYTPAQSVNNDLNKYYEFGERYTIGDPGESTRYHQGMTQNQTSNLSQPALFVFNKGDNYFRYRNINVGAEYNYTIPDYEQGIARTTMGVNFDNQTYVDANITPGNSPNQNLVGFDLATNTDRAILNVTTGGPYQFRLVGSIIVNFSDFGEYFTYYLQDSQGNITYLVPIQYITQGPHTFNFDVTFQMASNTRMFIFAYSQGDYRNSKTYSTTKLKITRQLPYNVPVIDANYSDYFESSVNSNGRAYVEEPSARRAYNPILLRWGRANIINSNLNEVSRFTPLNFDEIDDANGDIEVLSVESRRLDVLQRRKCGWYGIYSKVIQDNEGSNTLVTTDVIINKNNIQYLAGNYGVGGQKWSFAKTKLGYFFTDPVRGYQVRRSMDGLIPVSEIYKGRFYIRNLITPYNNEYLRSNGSISKIIGYFDFFEEQYVTLLQGGTLNGKTILPECFAFNEFRNGYGTFFDFTKAEWLICAGDKTYMWRNGQIYIQDVETNGGWCDFFGEKYHPSVTLVFNDKDAIKKVYDAIAYQSNQLWISPENGDIITSMVNPQTGKQQISKLRTPDFDIQENLRYAAFLRDANSMNDKRMALVEGDYLNGVWVQVKLVYQGNNFAYLYLPYISWQQSNRNL